MASFVIHHIAGEQLLLKLEEVYKIELEEDKKNQFLLGNLIVDSIKTEKEISKNIATQKSKDLQRKIRKQIQIEKRITHFRNEKDQNLCIQAPQVNEFCRKYKDLIMTDLSALGYFYHLYVDKLFFDDLFCDTFECLDQNEQPTMYIDKVKTMMVKKNGKISPVEEFWSHEGDVSIYHDYTVMNQLLLEYYGTSFEAEKLYAFAAVQFFNPGIEEVDYKNIADVISKTAQYIEQSPHVQNTGLNVFDENIVKDFIAKTVSSFISEYGTLIERNLSSFPKIKKRNIIGK